MFRLSVCSVISGPSILVPEHHRIERSTLTLQISHIRPDVRIQRVHHHLAVRGAGDLDAAIYQARGGLGPPPGIVLADVLGLGQEIGQLAAVKLGLAQDAALEQVFAGGIEGAMQEGKEGNGIAGEDLAVGLGDRPGDGDALDDGVGGGHAVKAFLASACLYREGESE